MNPAAQPPRRPAGRGGQGSARRQPRPAPRQPVPDQYRPEYWFVLAVSPQMRARYPDSPLSLEEALQRGTRQPGTSTSAAGPAGNQPPAQLDDGPSFWTELPGTPTSPRRARAAIRHILTSWGLASLSPDTELLASELVANAAEHAPGQPIGMLIRRHTTQVGQSAITCEVTDRSPQLPQAGPASADSERGRGLRVVAALADDRGYTARPGGKTAWFTLASKEPSRTAEPEAEAGA